jgi:hypothetical protein
LSVPLPKPLISLLKSELPFKAKKFNEIKILIGLLMRNEMRC